VKSDEKAVKQEQHTNQHKYYKVKRGDNLGLIANKYDVAVAEIKKWNGLRVILSLTEKFKNHYYRNRGSNRKNLEQTCLSRCKSR
jgi:hypothetical protein